MKGILEFKAFIVFIAVFFLAAGISMAQSANGVEKVDDDIKATFTVSPTKKMLDLSLTDADTGDEIREAKAKATVTMPDGSRVEKELVGMKMGATFSFMNSIEMMIEGTYVFDISVKTAEKDAAFIFRYEFK